MITVLRTLFKMRSAAAAALALVGAASALTIPADSETHIASRGSSGLEGGTPYRGSLDWSVGCPSAAQSHRPGPGIGFPIQEHAEEWSEGSLEGYSQGYHAGLWLLRPAGQGQGRSGLYSDGFCSGFREGLAKGRSLRAPPDVPPGQDKGLSAAKPGAAGVSEGRAPNPDWPIRPVRPLSRAYSDGLSEGFPQGYAEGLLPCSRFNHTHDVPPGHYAGRSDLYAEGYSRGFSLGYAEGRAVVAGKFLCGLEGVPVEVDGGVLAGRGQAKVPPEHERPVIAKPPAEEPAPWTPPPPPADPSWEAAYRRCFT